MARADLAQMLRALVVLKLENGAHGEAAPLESALEILEHEPIECDEHAPIAVVAKAKRGRPRKPTPRTECGGVVYQRTCADCGTVINRCEEHGGRKAASRRLVMHLERSHQRRSAC